MNDSHKILAALSYILWPIAVIALFIEQDKRDNSLKYHACNALGFALAVFIVSIAVMLVAWIPIIGFAVATIFWVAIIILAIMYALKAYNGEKVVIPVITDLVKKNVKGL
jgi:uncharacterized membrane protein